MRKEYDFSNGVRGKYFDRYKSMQLKVSLDPDVARMFPDSKSVNDALRLLATAAKRAAAAKTTRTAPGTRRRAG